MATTSTFIDVSPPLEILIERSPMPNFLVLILIHLLVFNYFFSMKDYGILENLDLCSIYSFSKMIICHMTLYAIK